MLWLSRAARPGPLPRQVLGYLAPLRCRLLSFQKLRAPLPSPPRSSPAMATAHLSPALAVSSPRRLTCNLSQSPVSAQPGRRAVLRSCSLPLLLGLAAAGRGGWRAAAAVESRTVQQGEDGAEGAADASSKLVLVVGGTGGVGQLVVASLLSRKIKTRLLLRNPEKAVTLFGKQDESVLQVYEADTRNVDAFSPEMFEGLFS
ncbi:hypothetical protein ACQ4PT_059820 [Festuca glaucescens]